MQPMETVALLVAAALIVVVMGIGARRRGELGCWAWSWAVLIATGGLLQVGVIWQPALAVGVLLAVLFPGLQLAGAFEHVGRPVPRWLLPGFVVLASLRLVTALAGFPGESHLVVLPFEIAALAAAARLVFTSSAERGRTAMEWLLIAGFLVIGAAEIADAVLDIVGPPPGLPWIVWLGIGFPIGVNQILARFDRVQRLLAHSLRQRESALGALGESNERFRAIAEHAHDVILEADAERRIQYANPRIRELIGYAPEEILGCDLRDFAWEPSRFPTSADLENGADLLTPVMIRHRDGSPRWVDASAQVYRRGREPHVVVVARDVTERLRVDDQTRKAQKLESLGVLAGGIAHDFNNLLTGILGNADVALASLPAASPAGGPVGQIIESAEHAAELTRQLQAYAGGSPFAIRPVDVSEEVRSRAELLRTTVGDGVQLELELADDLPAARADPTYVVQAVLNLVINGAEACGDEPGTVRIRTGQIELRTPLPVPATGKLEPGQYVFVEVQDTGHGIEESMRDRVFDPFFTTKATGRGLGLAMVHGVAQTLRGAILVDSTPDKGTSFQMLLPATSARPEALAPRVGSEPCGNACVLVVDDDQTVLKVVRSVLEARGYGVRTASSGAHAEAVMREHGSQISLVLLDALMPGERAETVLARIRAGRDVPPVLLMSGYTESEATRRFSESGELAGFLPKPFRAESLVAAIQAALAGAA